MSEQRKVRAAFGRMMLSTTGDGDWGIVSGAIDDLEASRAETAKLRETLRATEALLAKADQVAAVQVERAETLEGEAEKLRERVAELEKERESMCTLAEGWPLPLLQWAEEPCHMVNIEPLVEGVRFSISVIDNGKVSVIAAATLAPFRAQRVGAAILRALLARAEGGSVEALIQHGLRMPTTEERQERLDRETGLALDDARDGDWANEDYWPF